MALWLTAAHHTKIQLAQLFHLFLPLTLWLSRPFIPLRLARPVSLTSTTFSAFPPPPLLLQMHFYCVEVVAERARWRRGLVCERSFVRVRKGERAPRVRPCPLHRSRPHTHASSSVLGTKKKRGNKARANDATCTYYSRPSHLEDEQAAVVEREEPLLPVRRVQRPQQDRDDREVGRSGLAGPDLAQRLLDSAPAAGKQRLDLAVGVSHPPRVHV